MRPFPRQQRPIPIGWGQHAVLSLHNVYTFDCINATHGLGLYNDKTSILRANMIRDFRIYVAQVGV